MNVEVLVADGFFSDRAAATTMLGDWELFEREPARADLGWRYGLGPDVTDAAIRTTEIGNWLAHRVRPQASVRGRA
jgi:GMP synthase (glutamine-hydrolysing)